MASRPHAVVPAVVTAFLLASTVLAGCGGGEATDAAPPDVPAAQTSGSAGSGSAATAGTDSTSDGDTADDGSSEAPPFPADAEADTADASSDAAVTVRDIRIGRHEGFDRVVLEVGGEGTPGWDVRYVDRASSQGSGAAVEVAGDAVLQVTVTGAGYPYTTGVEEFSGPDPLAVAGTEVVTELVFDATYEGTTVAFVGTTARTPFRVYLLEAPTRIVLEVAHPG